MQNKLRNITINSESYYYRFTYKYLKEPYDDYKCISYFRTYSYEGKNTPLIIKFETKADYYEGNPLNVGADGINLNCPKWAQKLILYGIDSGWNGEKIVDLECSYEILERLNY